ncbi:MAG: hypothetical protein HYZ37_04105 [Candidatus Solibacter usitatus]|nr:hypothetical protein [Candidatus Solibacter usitatus]
MRKFIYWEYRRGSWQYDVMVGLILAFIFLSPREIFRDQPRANNVILLPSEKGQTHFWIEPDLLTGADEAQRLIRANQLFRAKSGRKHRVTRVEAIFDAEQEIRGYMAYVTE